MSTGTAIFLIFLVIIAAAVAIFAMRRSDSGTPTAPRERYEPGPSAPRSSSPAYYEPAPRVIVDQRPVYVEPYRSPMNDLTNLIVAEEIIEEIHEERREEYFEDRRESYIEDRGEERYEAPAQDFGNNSDFGGGWDNGGGDFGGDGSF
jgi:uncharacterized membrane protein YgcG